MSAALTAEPATAVSCSTCRPPATQIIDAHGRPRTLTVEAMSGLLAYSYWLRSASAAQLDDDAAARAARAT